MTTLETLKEEARRKIYRALVEDGIISESVAPFFSETRAAVDSLVEDCISIGKQEAVEEMRIRAWKFFRHGTAQSAEEWEQEMINGWGEEPKDLLQAVGGEKV